MSQKHNLKGACDAFLDALANATPETTWTLVAPAQALISAIPSPGIPRELRQIGLKSNEDIAEVDVSKVKAARTGMQWLLYLGSDQGSIAAALLSQCNGLVEDGPRREWFGRKIKEIENATDQLVELWEETGWLTDLVTLSQAAALVNRKKRYLEGLKSKMPAPRIKGGGGKPAEWSWAELRPWLEEQFARKLPKQFPFHLHASEKN